MEEQPISSSASQIAELTTGLEAKTAGPIEPPKFLKIVRGPVRPEYLPPLEAVKFDRLANTLAAAILGLWLILVGTVWFASLDGTGGAAKQLPEASNGTENREQQTPNVSGGPADPTMQIPK